LTSNEPPIRIMLVDDKPERAAWLDEVLKSKGLQVVGALPSISGLLNQIEQKKPDLILMDLQSPGRDVLESLSVVNTYLPKPVVMFSEQDDDGFIEEAVAAGVTAYMSAELEAARVKPILTLAMAQFKSFQGLREELERTRNELVRSSLVGKAVTLITQHKKVSEVEAHKVLRQMAMSKNVSLEKTAKIIIEELGKP